MNDKNKALFFENENDEVTVISLTDNDGNTLDAQIVASLEIEDYEKEYIAVLPVEGSEQFPENQLIVLIYSEDEDGNPLFRGIMDEKELAEISEAFVQYFDSQDED